MRGKGNVHSPSQWCMATHCDTPGHEHPHHPQLGHIQHNFYPTCTHETCKNPNSFWKLPKWDGSPSHWLHDLKLQKIDAWPGNCRNMANCVWQGFLEAWHKGATKLGQKVQMRCLSWRMTKYSMHLQQNKILLTQIQSLITTLRRMIPTKLESRQVVNYNSEASVQTADLDMAKFHWNSVVSTENAWYMCLNNKNVYLTVVLEYFEYMKIPLLLFPAWTIKQYNLNEWAIDGWVYIKMRQAEWGFPQWGILANKCLCRKLAPFGYYKSTNTLGLWHHESKPITFTLVVDNFRIKFVNKTNVDHLISSIKQMYTLTED